MNNHLSRFLGISVLAATIMLASCDKEEASPYIVSRVTTYPTIALTDAPILSVFKGQAFNDPGAVTKIGDQTVETKVTGTVDTNTLGVYTITYTGQNSDGFTASTSRLVAVVDPAVANEDISGSYARTNGAPVTITKIGPGIYRNSNFGGVLPPSAFIQPSYLAQVSPTQLVFPTQNVPNIGEVSFQNVSTTLADGKIVGYKYVVINPSFGTALRTFVKQ
ncbi:DUF5011 domain-containing protein [Hymenobacter sp. BT18]|uniref:immunoglobulin-like domain-containing protein n=1 Tax=Hymenobacter sp. BT18 TaxID=2835648 RepID=UPI00143EDC9B|nr:immunoglobulin-like domain-containing protein [Hymenobacter sp. BT18]QIX60722.1 DUF5011 domain-containing protein [Hymenobacter sp. BT18]